MSDRRTRQGRLGRAGRVAALTACAGVVVLVSILSAPTILASTATITTQLSTNTLVVGFPLAIPGTVTDTVTVLGEPEVTGYNVYVHVYKASGTPPTAYGDSIATWEVALNSDGVATSPPFAPESAGTFCFEASFIGDQSANSGDSPIETSSCEILTVTKFPASLTTVPTPPATSGTTLSDTADMSIYPVAPAEGGSGEYGAVDFTLYSDPACTDAVEGGSSSGSIVYTGTEFQATASITFSSPLPAGTYYWIATYNGNYDDLAYTSSCGEPTVVQAGGQLAASTSTPATGSGLGGAGVVGGILALMGVLLLAAGRLAGRSRLSS